MMIVSNIPVKGTLKMEKKILRMNLMMRKWRKRMKKSTTTTMNKKMNKLWKKKRRITKEIKWVKRTLSKRRQVQLKKKAWNARKK